jgi:hypothetical protein
MIRNNSSNITKKNSSLCQHFYYACNIEVKFLSRILITLTEAFATIKVGKQYSYSDQ